ncbi:hypothetical protein ACS41U_19800 [Salmonella enterica]|uniref:hypothetical protein n=1 Tax=Salmonella enterica TaxID=28901 RepID=UPI002973EB0C|nr:hypothetical protein [Salmonella enterica]
MAISLRMSLICTCVLSTIVSSIVPVNAAGREEPAVYKIDRGSPSLKSHGKYIDEMISDFMEKNNLPGLSMAIVQAPYIPRAAGYGMATLTNDGKDVMEYRANNAGFYCGSNFPTG